jgi:hypothetical protein
MILAALIGAGASMGSNFLKSKEEAKVAQLNNMQEMASSMYGTPNQPIKPTGSLTSNALGAIPNFLQYYTMLGGKFGNSSSVATPTGGV